MTVCVFCKILKGELPAYKLYEDDRVIAILDIRPVRPGATMVIPKEHYEHFICVPEDLALHIVAVAMKIGRKMDYELKPMRVGFAVSGFGVAHVHYHVIPMFGAHDITSSVYARVEDGKILFAADTIPLARLETQQETVSRLSISG